MVRKAISGYKLGNACARFFQKGFAHELLALVSSPLWRETFDRVDYAEITGELLSKFYHGLGLREMPNWCDWVSLRPEGGTKGSLLTKVLSAHELLSLNAKTAAGGSISVEVLDAAGRPLDKYAGQNAAVFTGDAIEGRLAWSGGAVQQLPDGPFRLRLVLDRADLFAINFPNASSQGGVPRNP